jgi:cyclopropane fatty-acyl-phospholipid synthase-like methyltransferase
MTNQPSPPREHEGRVQAFFETPQRYLHKTFGIRIRQELVQDFLGAEPLGHVLDLGCGDGSLSLPLAPRAASLTLVDLSRAMLRLAEDAVPPTVRPKVHFFRGDYATVRTTGRAYDVVLAIGLLAHVPAPAELFRVLSEAAVPGGRLLLQLSSATHPLVRLGHVLRRSRYRLTRTTLPQVETWLREHGFAPVRVRRFGLQCPGMGRLPDRLLYRYEKRVLDSSLLSRLGTDYFILAEKQPARL